MRRCHSCRSDDVSTLLNAIFPSSVTDTLVPYVDPSLEGVNTKCKFCGISYPRVNVERKEACVPCMSVRITDPISELLSTDISRIIAHDYLDSSELLIRDPPYVVVVSYPEVNSWILIVVIVVIAFAVAMYELI